MSTVVGLCQKNVARTWVPGTCVSQPRRKSSKQRSKQRSRAQQGVRNRKTPFHSCMIENLMEMLTLALQGKHFVVQSERLLWPQRT
jgi:hypothetical protein